MSAKTNKPAVTLAMMVATFLVAIEGTIVSTAMPKIAADLGGIYLISWVFAIYLLTSAVTAPIYGKLADLFGRKRIFTVGTVLFLLGSMLSGLSQTIVQLIWFRAFQGIGAGAVLPLTFTIIGDIYPYEQRAKVQGLFSAIWGISGILGPLTGGFLVDHVSWRWIFYLNFPFGLLSMLLLWLFLHEETDRKRKKVDIGGAVTFTAGMTLLLYALLSGGTTYAWTSAPMLAFFALATLFLAWFLAIQSKSEEPLLPLKIFRIPVIALSNLSGFLISAVLIAINAYLPLWIQGVLGEGATQSGFVLMPMSLSWPLGATLGGWLLVKMGPRFTTVTGTAAIALASIWLVFIDAASPGWEYFLIVVIAGFGFGFAVTSFNVLIQSAVDWHLRGITTASNTFLRSLGQTVGIAVFGTIFNQTVAGRLGEGARETDVNQLLDAGLATAIPPAVQEQLREALAAGIHNIYLLAALFALAGFLVTFRLPRRRVEPATNLANAGEGKRGR